MVFVKRKKKPFKAGGEDRKPFKPAKPKAERTRAEREASATSRDVALQFEQRAPGVKQGKIDPGVDPTAEEITAFKERTEIKESKEDFPKFRDEVIYIDGKKTTQSVPIQTPELDAGFFTGEGQIQRGEKIAEFAKQSGLTDVATAGSIGMGGLGKAPTVIQIADANAAANAARTFIPNKILESVGKDAGLTKAGIGQLKRAIGVKRIQAIANQQWNLKTMSLTTRILAKMGLSKNGAKAIAGLAGTIILGKFELAEATDKYGIAIWQNQVAGNLEAVKELEQELLEITDPDTWDNIKSWLPLISAYHGITTNIKAAAISAKHFVDLAEQEQRILTGEEESQFTKERRASEKALKGGN